MQDIKKKHMASRHQKKKEIIYISQICIYILNYAFKITICMFTELSQLCEKIEHVLKHLLNFNTYCRITI